MIPKLEYGSKVCNPSLLEEEFYLFFSESIDIHPLLGDEHLELSLNLGWTLSIGAEYRNLSLILL
jgi:hypothetical protein